jgi:hypothetical protein
MKTLYFATFLLIALIGGGIYLAVTYKAPDATVGLSENVPTVVTTPIISTTTATPPPLPVSVLHIPKTTTPSAQNQTSMPTPVAPGAPLNLASEFVMERSNRHTEYIRICRVSKFFPDRPDTRYDVL